MMLMPLLSHQVCGGVVVPPAEYAAVTNDTRSWQDLALLTTPPPVKSGHRVREDVHDMFLK